MTVPLRTALRTPISARAAIPRRLVVLLLLACTIAAPECLASSATDRVLAHVRVPAGFRFEVYSDAVPGARALTISPNGTVFVGSRVGNVYALSRAQGEPSATLHVIARDLNMPNGVAFRDGALYVAELHRLVRYDEIEASLAQAPPPKVVRDDLPRDFHHGMKYIAFGPDGRLYMTIGSPCNACDEPRYGTIVRMNADGSGQEVFARGIRNSVGLTWHPTARTLWFTDNGRDYLGDDAPPCELNHAPAAGLDFGFPYCHGAGIADPEYAHLGQCAKMIPPTQNLGPHVAPLGLTFYTGASFPETYRGHVFIAEHGSWNRSVPNGYRIALVRLQGDAAAGYEPFVSGFQLDEEIYGRPVDVAIDRDGALLISDDHAGAVYRVSYVALR